MEQEAISTITSKSQITIPKMIRHRLALQPGDKVRFLIGDDDLVKVSKANDASNMWDLAREQEKKYGRFADTPEVDWGEDVESEDLN